MLLFFSQKTAVFLCALPMDFVSDICYTEIETGCERSIFFVYFA